MRNIYLLLPLLFAFAFTNAQPQAGMGGVPQQKLPVDSNVRYGKLENGLTYYIRHNKYPEKRADFYIAQNVGSMQEEDNQAGLAHFLEHMAFNGTKHYPGRETIASYLETIGAKFGANINAYTGFDETVYTLMNIPVTRQAIIDSTLLILHDWSGYISLENADIDKERSIIKEEWRTRSGSSTRIWEKQLPIIFAGSKYADRMPIGKMEIVENFEHQVIKDYYRKWYRPDLQAIIVVGDIDADKVETQVKEMFSKIPMLENAAERIYYPVLDNEEPIISILSDKEEMYSRITYYIKHNVLPKEVKQTEMGYIVELATSLAGTMLAERLTDISKTPESPFVAAFAFDGNFFVSKTKDAWTSIAISKEGMEKESLSALIRETERVKRFGFTDAELERAKANYMKRIEDTYNNRDKQQNKTYVQEYVRSFTDGEPIPGIEYEYEMVKKIFPGITADMINGITVQLFTDKNNVITITGPEKEGLVFPTEAEVRGIMKNVKAEDIDPYMEEVITEPLVSEMPKAGKVVKDEKDHAFKDMTIWTLSNGIQVAILPTTHKDDEILMSATAYGGSSLAPNSIIQEVGLASSVPYIGGLGNFNSTDLKKVLAGKTANVTPYIHNATYGLNGNSNKKDLETMMQLAYLHLTSARKDEGMFKNVKEMIMTQVKNMASQPDFALGQYTTFSKYGYNPRYISMTEEDVEKLDYDAIVGFYKEVFKNPGALKFTFVGNVDKEVLKPLVEIYLASLPSGDTKVTYNKNNIAEIREGKSKTVFEQSMVEPKTTSYSLYKATFDYTQKNRLALGMLKNILDIVYTKAVREDEGGTYGVRQGIYINRVPVGETTLTIQFDTDPERVDRIVPIIHAELEKIAKEGPKDEDFSKTKENALKVFSENQIQNGYWKSIAEAKLFYNEDNATNARSITESISKEDIKNLANGFVSQGNLLEVIMNPKSK